MAERWNGQLAAIRYGSAVIAIRKGAGFCWNATKSIVLMVSPGAGFSQVHLNKRMLRPLWVGHLPEFPKQSFDLAQLVLIHQEGEQVVQVFHDRRMFVAPELAMHGQRLVVRSRGVGGSVLSRQNAP